MLVQSSPPTRLIGSSPIRTPARAASSPMVRRPSTTVSRSSPGPVRHTTELGSNRASLCTDAQIASIRLLRSAGPSISGSGRIDGTAGTAAALPSPLASSCSSAWSSPSSGSLISQMPIPSTPAAAYARRSASNVAPSVVICEIEKGGRMQGILRLPRPEERADPSGDPPGDRRLQQLLRDERARARTEPRTGPSARTDLEETVDRRAVTGLAREGPPEKVLIERERTGVRVALLEIDVRLLQVRGRKDDSFQNRGLEVGDVLSKPGLDPVRIALAE